MPGHRRAAHVPGQASGACPDGAGGLGTPRRPHGRRVRASCVRQAGGAGAVRARRHGGRRSRCGDRRPCQAGRPGGRARADGSLGPGGRERAGSSAAAVPRPEGDLAAPRGPHLDGVGLSGLGRNTRSRGQVGRGRLRVGDRERTPGAARHVVAAGDTGTGRRAGAQPGAETVGRQRPCAGPTHRPAGRSPTGDHRRRRRRARPRVTGPGLAPPRSLVAGRRRRSTHPAPPHVRGRCLELAGTSRQRALPRLPPRPGARVAFAPRRSPDPRRGGVPRPR